MMTPFTERIPGAYGLDLVIKGGSLPHVGVARGIGWNVTWEPADEDALRRAHEALATAINDHLLNWRGTHNRVYIAGPMTGLNDYNRSAFGEAAEKLHAAGWAPLNPATITLTNARWSDYMRATARLLTEADGVALLPGWEESRGARIEEQWATSVGLDVRPLSEWMNA